jgi:hypothetical protein
LGHNWVPLHGNRRWISLQTRGVVMIWQQQLIYARRLSQSNEFEWNQYFIYTGMNNEMNWTGWIWFFYDDKPVLLLLLALSAVLGCRKKNGGSSPIVFPDQGL